MQLAKTLIATVLLVFICVPGASACSWISPCKPHHLRHVKPKHDLMDIRLEKRVTKLEHEMALQKTYIQALFMSVARAHERINGKN